MQDEQRRQLLREIIAEFRANGGQVSGPWAGRNLLLLTTIGVRSGRSRTWPMTYLRDGDQLVVFAANSGRPKRPGWYYNLRAHPAATVEVGPDIVPVVATFVEGPERQRLWERQLTETPFLADFEADNGRQIPVVRLTPTS
ncbi:nitroreductase family deazaflavin-dependent oxidoreductase [Nocardia sp. NPDC051756]|uniref:nitroreductase family deazaflavin-dependent oxidoreductase n=1 Tax=Nocardia sp. NPDC051756 TaxID=3154751 RepID=UPI00341A7128